MTSSDNQLWFFVLEEFANDRDYLQNFMTKGEFSEMGMTLSNALKATGSKAKAEDFFFYINSNSMPASVVMLTDEAIPVMWELYCRGDDVVTVQIRSRKKGSPTSTRAPSHDHSLAERHKVSGGRIVPNIILRPPLPISKESTNLGTSEPVSSVPASEQVILDLADGDHEVFSKDFLLGQHSSSRFANLLSNPCVGAIDTSIGDGKKLTDVLVTARKPDSHERDIVLSKDIWLTSLVRGPWKESFLPIWNERLELESTHAALLAKFKQLPHFEWNVKVFIRDLMIYDEHAARRLNETDRVFYLGVPYFTPSLAQALLALPFARSNLRGELNKLLKRVEDAGEELCSANHLAPLYQLAFDMNWSDFKEQKFKGLNNMTPTGPPSPAPTQPGTENKKKGGQQIYKKK